MNIISLEFNFADFAFVTLLKCIAKMFAWYLISRKQFIREINPTQNLRLLQYVFLAVEYGYIMFQDGQDVMINHIMKKGDGENSTGFLLLHNLFPCNMN